MGQRDALPSKLLTGKGVITEFLRVIKAGKCMCSRLYQPVVAKGGGARGGVVKRWGGLGVAMRLRKSE